MRLTQAILARKKKVALEAEEIVDQSVIDGQPVETEVTEPVDELPVDETAVTEAPVEDAVVEVPAEDSVVEEPIVTEEPGAGEIVPPDAEAVEPEPEVIPTTDEGEVTVDQVTAVATGEPEEVIAEAVAEADTAAGDPITPEEVVEENDELNEELAATDEVEPVSSEPTLPEDPLDIPVEEPVVDVPVEDAVVEEPAAVDEPVTEDEVVEETPEEVAETTEVPVATEDQTEEQPGPIDDTSPAATIDPSTEDGNSTVSNEGFTGGLVGFLAGSLSWAPFIGAGVNAAVKLKRINLRKDIEVIAKRIEKVRQGDISDAEKNGLDIPKKYRETDWVEVIKSALLGQFFGPFYGAHQGSEIQNLNKELADKLAELEKEIESAGISVESFATEDCSCEDELLIPDAPIDECEEENGIYEEAIDTYPQVVEVLEASLDNGGISNEAMQLLNIFTKRDGIPVDNNVSLENFNHTARSQTRVALEAIKEDIVEWIKKFVANVVEHAKAAAVYLKNLFDIAEQLKKRAASVKEKVSADGQVSGGKVPQFKSVRFILKDNSADRYTDNLNAVVTLGQHIYTTLISGGVKVANDAVGIFRTKIVSKLVDTSTTDVSGLLPDALRDIESTVADFVKNKVRNVFPNVDNGYFSDTLLGGVTLGVDVDLAGSENVTDLKMVIVPKTSEGEVGEIPALSPAEADQVIRNVDRLLDVVGNTKSEAAEAEKLVSEFSSELTRLVKLSDNHNNDQSVTTGAIAKAITSTLRIVTGLSSGPATVTNKYLLHVGSAALDYIEASFKGSVAPVSEPASDE